MSVNPTSAMSVHRFAERDRTRWEQFVLGCEEATFFHRIGWMKVFEDHFRYRTHYFFAERAGAIVAVLPLVEVKSLLFGHALVSLPHAVYGGVAASDPEGVLALHSQATALAFELGVEHLELRNRAEREPEWPRQSLYCTFRKALLPDDEANLLAVPRKQRAMIRKALGRGLRADLDEDVDRFYALYADNQHRHGTPAHSKGYFQALKKEFGADCELTTVVAPDGTPVSGVLSFYFRNEVLPYYAGDLPLARNLAANDFKYWSLMRQAVARGCTVFDYGRSKRNTGSFDFKRNWGFEPEPLHYEFHLLRRTRIPENNPSNPKFRTLIAMWRRLPRRAVNTIGPAIVRHLG